MEINGYFTRRGLELSAKLASGANLQITRVVAGSGATADTLAVTTLPQPRQTLAVNTPTRSGTTATIPATLTAALAETSYTLTELGVYAADPDQGEILYKLYRLDTPVNITAGSRMVLRFYLEETVSQDVDVTVSCSPDGLITEAKLEPLCSKVFSSYASKKTVTLEAAELPAYLAALPRLLTEQLEIQVSGELTERVMMVGFYGSGSILIDGGADRACTLKNSVYIADCSISIALKRLTFEDPGAGGDVYHTTISVLNARQVYIEECALSSDGTGTAVRFSNDSMGWLYDCSIQSYGTAVSSIVMSMLGVINVTASGNSTGADVYNGGIILLHGDTPELVGGVQNTNYGGLIARGGRLL